MECLRISKCGITREEVIGLRLYTGPPFMKFKTVLRITGGSLPESSSHGESTVV